MKYTKIGFAITVAINEDYIVRANINKTELPDTYDFELELSTTDDICWIPVNENETYRMVGHAINSEVADYILKIDHDGYFSPAMEQYSFRKKCMGYGYKIIEECKELIEGRPA